MDKKAIAERLRALASDDMKRSKAARLRDVIDDVEAALAAGVPRSSVVDELSKHGLNMTLATFETTLKRIRQKRKAVITKTASHSNQSPSISPVPTTESTQQDAAESASHNPADIDTIIGNTPDLAALAKFAKRRNTK